MIKFSKGFLPLAIIVLIFTLFACATDINMPVSSSDLVVHATSNDGIERDIKGYKKSKNGTDYIYLFLPCNANKAELNVAFGATTQKLDLTSPIKAVLSDGTYTIVAMNSNIPTLYFEVDESQGTIDAMNSDKAHETACVGTFLLDIPNGMAAAKGWEEYYSDGTSKIKGRGNATWGLDKKAYQIKLGEKQNILGMGKSKTWIILANFGDRSLIRNKLAYDFANDMGLKYSIGSEFVDVFFNGEYQGNYLLTEKVEVGSKRVDIYDLEQPDTKPDADRLTGGYLIEYDRLAQSELTWFKGPKTERLISVKSPEAATPEQKKYISEFVSDMENAIYSEDGKNDKGKYYTEYMDIDSFIKIYWIHEIFKNGDFFWGSTFMYKDVGENELLYSGPTWDFDITLANACANAGAETLARQANLATPIGWWARTTAEGFTKYLFNHEDFRIRNKEIYDLTVKQYLLKLSERAEEYASYIRESAEMNFIRWDVLEKSHQWQTPNTSTTYRGEVDFVKSYIESRAEWIDRTMNSITATSNEGTSLNPFLINSADDFKALRDDVNAGEGYMGYYFKQTADIDLNNEEFMPIGNSNEGFLGYYNGGGYKIKNLKITTASVNDPTRPAGLFGIVSGGEVCNVNVDSGEIDVIAKEAGALVGRMNGAKVYNCTNKATVTNNANSSYQMAGGIAGHLVSGTSSAIANCINYGTVNAPRAISGTCRGVGGIAGHISTGGRIIGCLNLAKINASFGLAGFSGGIVGEHSGNHPLITYCYWLTGNNGIENGKGVLPGIEPENTSGFNAIGMSTADIKSADFTNNLNKYIMAIAKSADLLFTDLKMWEKTVDYPILSDTFARVDLLPRFEPQWLLSDRNTAQRWISSTSGARAQFNNGCLEMIPLNRDPITMITLAGNERFSADDYHYIALRMKVLSSVNYGGFFFGTDLFEGPLGPDFSEFKVLNDNQWHNYVIDISAYSHNRWHGEVYALRLDPINSEDLQATISLERIGVFKTEASANTFLAGAVEIDNVLKDDIQKVFIPSNVASSKYDKSEYMLKSNTPYGEKPNSAAEPIVFYVDNGMNEYVVPICYTNSLNFTSYVANKPGTYKLGYYFKQYQDIANHWGSEYINFVSSRKLFGGTDKDEFSPDMAMTRGMFITVLGRVHGIDNTLYDGKETGFNDINSAEYYSPYVQWASENMLVDPLTSKSFSPEEPIRREDMAQIICRYIKKYGYSLNSVSQTIDFIDLDNISTENKQAISEIQKVGIINGKEQNTFDPLGISTRAEVSAVITRLIKSILKEL